MTKILRREEVVTLPARQGRIDPDEFFQTGSGVYVWDDFRTLAVSKAEVVESAPEMQLAPFTLIEKATDAQIQAELPEGHVFGDVSIFCYHLAETI